MYIARLVFLARETRLKQSALNYIFEQNNTHDILTPNHLPAACTGFSFIPPSVASMCHKFITELPQLANWYKGVSRRFTSFT